jgi:NAD(P)-dependent dehydrogenase (short-subunit alcohol dehydrogenase family)
MGFLPTRTQRAQFLEIDVADSGSISRAAQKFATMVDHLDVLVNNAGVLEDGKATVLDVEVAVIRRTLETNTLGPLLVTQAMLPLLQRAPAGAACLGPAAAYADAVGAPASPRPGTADGSACDCRQSRPGATAPSTAGSPSGGARRHGVAALPAVAPRAAGDARRSSNC